MFDLFPEDPSIDSITVSGFAFAEMLGVVLRDGFHGSKPREEHAIGHHSCPASNGSVGTLDETKSGARGAVANGEAILPLRNPRVSMGTHAALETVLEVLAGPEVPAESRLPSEPFELPA
eukprot:15443047-Alexandrium_andersonii.AAC.1